MIEKRNNHLDIMKGLGIIFVIIGHSTSGAICSLIHSVHMPLFFFIAGFFFKKREFFEFSKRNVKSLLLPYVYTCVIALLIALGIDCFCSKNFFHEKLFACIWGCGFDYYAPYLNMKFFNVGPIWFLLALLEAKFILWIFLKFRIDEAIRSVIVLLLAILANGIGSYLKLPFSLLAAFGALGFVYVGYLIASYKDISLPFIKKNYAIFAIVWFYCIAFSALDVNFGIYGALYIFDCIGALGGCVSLYVLVKNFARDDDANIMVWRMLTWLGKYSLIALCVHSIEYVFVRWSLFYGIFPFSHNTTSVIIVIMRIAVVLSVTWLVGKSNFIRKHVFNMKCV